MSKQAVKTTVTTPQRNAIQFGQWWEYRYPFRHFRASNVLSSKTYGERSSSFSEILEVTQGTREGQLKLKQSTANYDVQMLAMNSSLAPRFQPFFASRWLKSLANFLGIPFHAQIDGALHSAPKDSRTGWIHTDLCSAWFDADTQPSADGIVFPDRNRCDYFEGRPRVTGAKPVEYVRAATLIFYLCNKTWQPGKGGETGLYSAAKESENSKYGLVQPLDNTLLLFECSPHSYHRFVTNPGCRRNSIILWLHTTPKFASSKWSSDVINRRGGK